jgi:hypothetical protein
MTKQSIPRAPRSGYAMLAVLVFLAVSMVFIGLGQRRISALLRIEKARIADDDFNDGAVQAAGKALALLETGSPPSNPYDCGVTLTTSAGNVSYQVSFTSTVTNEWTIQVTPIASLGSLPTMPALFTPN